MFIFDSPLHVKPISYASSRLVLVAGMVSMLGGCGTLSSATIVSARTPVNEAVATTARQQTLMNIVRVYHNEAPVILDVVEADQAVNVGGQATGGVSGIGAIAGAMGGTLAGRTGSASGMVTASDNITNRYVPLQGQALISQLSSQITVETLNALYDSDWPIQSILEFAADRLSPDKDDFRLVQDALTFLDADNAISLATAKSGFSKDASAQTRLKFGDVTINTQPQSAGGGDTLNVYLASHLSKHVLTGPIQTNRTVWDHLYSLFVQTQPDPAGKNIRSASSPPTLIELRNSPRTHLANIPGTDFKNAYLGPVMRTRTAIGILKYIVTQPKVAFVAPEEYEYVISRPWNSPEYFRRCPSVEAYILDPSDPRGRQDKDEQLYYQIRSTQDVKSISSEIERIEKSHGHGESDNPRCFHSYVSDNVDFTTRKEFANALSTLRRYIIIVKSIAQPSASFTSWNDGEYYYYIMPDDRISQRNLMLVSQFLTIQATSTPTPSLTTISASGR